MYFFPEHSSMLPADDMAGSEVIHELVAMLRRAVTRKLAAIPHDTESAT